MDPGGEAGGEAGKNKKICPAKATSALYGTDSKLERSNDLLCQLLIQGDGRCDAG